MRPMLLSQTVRTSWYLSFGHEVNSAATHTHKHFPLSFPSKANNSTVPSDHERMGVRRKTSVVIYTSNKWVFRQLEERSCPKLKCHVRKQKRGKCCGVSMRLKANSTWTAISFTLLANVQSLDKWETVVCCFLLLFIFTETWLQDNIDDSEKPVVGHVAVVMRHCSTLIEVFLVKCWPFNLLREYSCVLVVAMCLPPSANQALAEL